MQKVSHNLLIEKSIDLFSDFSLIVLKDIQHHWTLPSLNSVKA